MNKEDIIVKVTDICRDVFDDEELVISYETTAAEVEGWDSLTHLNLINDLEVEFGIAFTLSEIQGAKNIGELIDAIIKHINEK